jgi:CheY-like chemotaxis protein
MYNPTWLVLVVDDEPDVLSLTKLFMKNIKVYDLPLEVFTAQSKAEALQLLQGPLTRSDGSYAPLAAAFIDVVMESDTAGLELIDYIRNTMKNKITPVYVRTGQPGTAPERAVIDQYDITGYFTKVEMTEDKLYSLMKSAVRQYAYISWLRGFLAATNRLADVRDSRQKMTDVVKGVIGTLQRDATGRQIPGYEVRTALAFDDTMAVVNGYESAEVPAKEMERLDAMPGVSLSKNGDKYVLDDKQLFIKVNRTPSNSEFRALSTRTAAPPDFITMIEYNWGKFAATLWKTAQ